MLHSAAHTARQTHTLGLWVMSLRSILHVSQYDQLSAIQFLAPLLARSYFSLFLFIERLYSIAGLPCRLLLRALELVKARVSPRSRLLSFICGLAPCITPSRLQGSEAHNPPGARKKNVWARSEMWLSVSRIPLIFG